MNRFFAAAAASLLAFAPATAYAQMMRGPEHGGTMGELRMYLRVANLTADQKAKVHQLERAGWEQAKPLIEQLHALREQIADKLANPGAVSAADLTPLQQQVASIREQLDQQRVQTALQIRGLLTVDQLTKVSERYAKMKELKKEMRDLVTPPAETTPTENAPAPAPGPATGENEPAGQ